MSLSRMFGAHLPVNHDGSPIIIPNGGDIDPDNHRKLPLPHSVLKTLRRWTFEDDDLHCVVVVGCSDNEVLFHDPATYPFLRASISQLVSCRPYASPESLSAEMRPLEEKDLGSFELISVTPEGVKMPLLNIGIKPGPKPTERHGLLKVINEEHIFGDIAGLTYDEDAYDYGEIQLASVIQRKIATTLQILSTVSGDLQQDLCNRVLKPHYYWLQHLPYQDLNMESTESLWFWDASVDWQNASKSLAAVLMRRNGQTEWSIRYQAISS